MPFEFEELSIKGVFLIKPKIFKDERGYFTESYKKSDFSGYGINVEFVQDNFSFSKKNVIRGLHFQKTPYEQAKLVRCIKGKIIDVAVDLRPSSPTYKKWVSVILSDENSCILFIPRGFAHGFGVLSDEAYVYYKCDNEYRAEYDSGVRYDDPEINISWGIENPIISEKDLKLPFLKDLRR